MSEFVLVLLCLLVSPSCLVHCGRALNVSKRKGIGRGEVPSLSPSGDILLHYN